LKDVCTNKFRNFSTRNQLKKYTCINFFLRND